MFTCRTCKLLQKSKAIKKITDDGTVSIAAPSIIDGLADYHCHYYWWGTGHPKKGFTCKHWKDFHGKHWL